MAAAITAAVEEILLVGTLDAAGGQNGNTEGKKDEVERRRTRRIKTFEQVGVFPHLGVIHAHEYTYFP